MAQHPLHLLVVEDDSDLAGLLASSARTRGMLPTAVLTAAEACRALEHQVFDVAAVDLALGSASGFDVLRAIEARGSATSVVVMSGDATIAAAIQSYEMSAFAYVQKPFDIDDFLRTVERAAEHCRMTLNNRRLFWELQTINDVADGISHSLELADVLHGALDRLCRALAVPNAAVRLKDEGTGTFELAVIIGPPEVRRTWTPHGGPVPRPSDAVIATGKPVVIEDVAAIVGEDVARTLLVRSAVSVPMIVADELIGTLTLSTGEPRRFSAADERLLTTIGAQIGGSVQSARLHAVVLRAKQQWEQTFDAIADPIGVYDSGRRLLRGNAALAGALGCGVTELQGRSCAEVGFCGGNCPQCAIGVAGHAQRRDEITTPDGRIFSVTTFPMRTGMHDAGAVVQVAKNVTQEIANARRLQALSEELAAANRQSTAALVQLRNTQAQLLQAEKLSAIGQLVAGVAHELNNPLTSVIGYAQLLQEEIGGDERPVDLDALRQDLQRIADESERAARIVRNLLAFARRQTTARAVHDATEIAERTLSLREYALRSSGVDVVRRLATGLPPVLVDVNQLQQALLNLILNAEHAMRGRPERRLEVGVRLNEEAAAIELYVSDSGHGIDPSHIGRIFDPFFTTRDVGEGTGLGLSICYGIVRDHGGQIVVQTRAGEGTTFSVLLPARVGTSPVPMRVLVVHGERGDHDMVPTALEAWGCHVTIASSSRAGLEHYRSGAFHAVFVEAQLLGADLPAWASVRGADSVRVPLMLIGGVEDGDVDRFGREQAAAVLAPPYQLRELRAAVQSVTEEYA